VYREEGEGLMEEKTQEECGGRGVYREEGEGVAGRREREGMCCFGEARLGGG
jgi:hypothetical protein